MHCMQPDVGRGGTQIYTKWQQLPGNIPVSHSDSISTTEPTEFVNDHDSVACVRNARFFTELCYA